MVLLVILKYVHKFFGIAPFKKCCLKKKAEPNSPSLEYGMNLVIGICLWLLRLGHKETLQLPSCSLVDHLLWEKPAAMSRGYQTVLWRGPRSEDLEPPANSHVKEPSWSISFKFINPSCDYNPSQLSSLYPEERHWPRTTQLSQLLIPDSRKLYKIINTCCLKSISFG